MTPDETAILSDDAQPLGHQCGQRKQSHGAQLWTKGGFSRVPAPRMQREDVVVHISDVFKECVDVVFTPTARAQQVGGRGVPKIFDSD